MNQENNAPFMTKNVSFAFFLSTLLGHSERTLTKNIVLYMNYGEAATLKNFYAPVNFPYNNWIKYFNQMATSKTWTQTLNLEPGPRPRKT